MAGISGGGSRLFFVAPDTTSTFPTMQFTFEDLPQESTFAALFDQYMIEGVEIIIKPSSSVLDLHSAASPNQVNPCVFIVADFDDATALTSISGALQYDNCVQMQGNEGVHIRIVPSVSPAIYAGGAFSGYGITGPQWLDCNSNTVPHYGIKMVVQALNTASTEFYQWNIDMYYHFAFQNIR
jgi:hypothetical protein